MSSFPFKVRGQLRAILAAIFLQGVLLFLDKESPSFGKTCPDGFRTTADKGKSYTTVSWPPVVATDNSGVNPVVSSSGVTPKYYIGKHLVKYNASDQAGNFKICQFYISVDGKLSIEFIPFATTYCNTFYYMANSKSGQD